MKKCSEDTQTQCLGCSKAEPKIFALLQTPFPGAWDGQNLIITYKPSLVRIEGHNFELSC